MKYKSLSRLILALIFGFGVVNTSLLDQGNLSFSPAYAVGVKTDKCTWAINHFNDGKRKIGVKGKGKYYSTLARSKTKKVYCSVSFDYFKKADAERLAKQACERKNKTPCQIQTFAYTDESLKKFN